MCPLLLHLKTIKKIKYCVMNWSAARVAHFCPYRSEPDTVNVSKSTELNIYHLKLPM